MRFTLLALSLAAVLAGCSSGEQGEDAAAKAQDVATALAAPMPPVPDPGTARRVEETNELYEFAYSYPRQAAAIPALKTILETDLVEARANIAAEAKAGREAAKELDFEFHPYDHATDWQVVTELPGWLSLSSTIAWYTGGAHPNYGFDSLLWDKAANRRRAVTDLFTSPEALRAAIQPAFCDSLDRQRAEKRGEPVVRDATGLFDDCIDPLASAVILGSSDRVHFDRIGVLVGPYAAGPYVEGDYEVTLPITTQVIAALKPQYRQFFSAGR